MYIKEIKSFKGRNIYSHRKVIKMVVDLQDWADVCTKDIPDFNQKLLHHLPGLKEHYCSIGKPGGFLSRLMQGTYLAHVIEHGAIEMLNMIGYQVSFGKARQIDDSSSYIVVYSYINDIAGIEVGKLVIKMIESLCNGKDYDIQNDLKRIKYKAEKCELGPSTRAIADAAIERGIPATRIGNSSILQLGYGKYQKCIEATITESTSCIAVDIACDKNITKQILQDIGIPVPEGGTCVTANEAIELANSLGYPVVIKPGMGNQGKGVSTNLTNKDEVLIAYNIAKKINETIIVEKYIKGNDYRVLVVGEQIAAVARRIPAHVVGDAKHTIEELVNIINNDPSRGEDHEKPMTKIVIDDITIQLLKKQGYTINSIPDNGEWVYLKTSSNLSTGGESIDCTEKIHPYNVQLATRAARIIGLDIAGIDIKCSDISIPITEDTGAVIEVNAAPGLRMHLYPSIGKARKVANTIIDFLYPSGSRHSIPIISITGTNGKTTTTRMVGSILKAYGLNVGMTTTGGVYINDKCIMNGDTTGPTSAQIVLNDRSIDVAVLETARGGIVRSGLGYDLSDVGVLTNISHDHLGSENINNLDDLLNIKSLVLEAVKSNGYAVLNADDPMVLKAAGQLKCNIIYFSRADNNIVIHKHLSQGGIAVFLKDSYITIATGNSLIQSIHVSKIPATCDGKLIHNIENSLAAVSVAYALHIPISIIEKSLCSFYNDELHNPGRFNVYNVRDFRVVVDYGHNIAGYKYIAEAVKNMGATRLIGIIGVPGDRDAESIKQIGKIAGQFFDKIIIKEDLDLRTRREGEVSKLLEEGALTGGMAKNNIEKIRYETEALNFAMSHAQPGDLIVIFYEKLEPILDIIKQSDMITEKKKEIHIVGK